MTTLTITDKLVEYNKLNRNHDYTYMFSDCGRTYNNGEREHEELKALYKELSQDEKDLAGLYHNHILKRARDGVGGDWSKPVVQVPDTLEEALKYYEAIY